MNTPAKLRYAAAALLIPAATIACDDDGTGPDGEVTGSVSAAITDGSSGAAAPVARARAGAFSGEAAGSAEVWIHSEADGWIRLGAPTTATVALQSEDKATVYGSATVAAGSYDRVRLVLDGFDADVAAGAVLGGITLDSGVTVRVGGADGYVEVEKELDFSVQASGSTALGFDLNSELWVTEETVEAGSAADTGIQAVVSAYIRS